MSENNANNLAPAAAPDNGNIADLPELRPADDNTHPLMKGLSQLPINRQLGLMLGFAISVAIAVAIVLWSQQESYSLLFAGLPEQDTSQIITILDEKGIPYKVDPGSGAIMVPNGQQRDIRLQLAGQGLPQSSASGYELLDKDSGFGTTDKMEQMRFQRALEGEIAQTVKTIQSIKSARVLLALPKQSVFMRKQKDPSASVLVDLYPGRVLEPAQIEAIVHLVASSVPLLAPGNVTVVDQRGRLLNAKQPSEGLGLSSKQFEYKTQLEDHLMGRIENILSPLVGATGLRTQVSAEVDFSARESTQEQFNPDLPALRSEQVDESASTEGAVQGVPGALSNQPPPAGVAPEVAVGGEGQNETRTLNTNKSATRNYELDKTITHVKRQPGQLSRLSVAVVVDYRGVPGDDGNISKQPYSLEELNRFENLVKQAVGFQAARGDMVTVTSAPFQKPEAIAELPDPPLWEQPWVLDLSKQAAAVLVLLFLVFGVLRPTMRGLVARTEEERKAAQLALAKAEAEAMGGVVRLDENGIPYAVPADQTDAGGDALALTQGTEDLLLLEAPQSYEKRLEYVQKLIDEDPLLVSQIIKTWVNQDG
ncbi:MAG: flagellar basal-body MS-ring/collar protein FliF [Methylococcales bacterium]|nr:flagellar basal-body MS-ring/collar protein FliF [Methylococcales bacterium]